MPSQAARFGSSTLTTTTSAVAAGLPAWSIALTVNGDIEKYSCTACGGPSTWKSDNDERVRNALTGTTVNRPPTFEVTAVPECPGAGMTCVRAAVPEPVTCTWSPVGRVYSRVCVLRLKPLAAAGCVPPPLVAARDGSPVGAPRTHWGARRPA